MHSKGRQPRAALLNRYSTQLGLLVSRQRTELALRVAHQEAERAAEEARLARINAETANRAKTQFMSSMSHELRTPLNSIIGFSEIIVSQAGSEPAEAKIGEYAGLIHESGAHLLKVINEILDISRIEAGSLDLREDWADIRGLVDMPVRLCRKDAEGKQLDLAVELAPDLPMFYCDARRIHQALLNLIANAAKFTPEGGRISVSVTREAEGERKGDLRMAVADTGIGIAPEHFADALAPFRQVENELGKRYNGTGLGLPLSKGFAELHGGSLQLESTLGKGTTVTLHFPRERLSDAAGAG